MQRQRPESCDRVSRQWCKRALAITFVFVSIMVVAVSIVVRYYMMALEMDEMSGRQFMRPLAVHDTCAGVDFNIQNVNGTSFEVAWHEEETLSRVYVSGADAWTVHGDVIRYGDGGAPCVRPFSYTQLTLQTKTKVNNSVVEVS